MSIVQTFQNCSITFGIISMLIIVVAYLHMYIYQSISHYIFWKLKQKHAMKISSVLCDIQLSFSMVVAVPCANILKAFFFSSSSKKSNQIHYYTLLLAKVHMYIRYTYFFRQITTFIKVRVAFIFGLQTFWSLDFTKIFESKGLKPKIKGHMNFYECCDLTKKVYLIVHM